MVVLACVLMFACGCHSKGGDDSDAGGGGWDAGGNVDGGNGNAATPPAGWRPFDDTSPWNTPIGDDPAIDPDSPALIDDFINSGNPDWTGYIGINIEVFSIPLYWVDEQTPIHEVVAESLGGVGWTGAAGAERH